MLSVAIAINDRNNKVVPFVVSLFTWAKAYHCELVFSDGQSVIADPRGVYWSKRDYDPYQWILLPLFEISADEEAEIRKAAEEVIASHAGYDWLGAILGRFSSSFDDPSKWYCSELTAYLLRNHVPTLNTEEWITPQKLWRKTADHLILAATQHGYTSYLSELTHGSAPES